MRGMSKYGGVSVDTIRNPPPPPLALPTLRDSWIPWLVPCIFISNVSMFAYSMYLNNCPSRIGYKCLYASRIGRFSFEPLSNNLLLGPLPDTLVKLGALEKNRLQGEEWRLFTCMWLHVGAIHLLANMISLLFIGIRLEMEFGFFRIGILYLLSGLGGSITSALKISDSSLSVGASGAIFGLLGAMLSELFINWTNYINKCSALTNLIFITALNLAMGFLPHVDGFAHLGGFIAGFLLGFILLMRPQYGYMSRKYVPSGYNNLKPRYNLCQYFLCVTALVFLIFGSALAYLMLLVVTRDKQNMAAYF